MAGDIELAKKLFGTVSSTATGASRTNSFSASSIGAGTGSDILTKLKYGTCTTNSTGRSVMVLIDGNDEPMEVTTYETLYEGDRVCLITQGSSVKLIAFKAGSVGGNMISVDGAFIDKLVSNDAFIGNLTSDSAFIGDLTSNTAFIDALSSSFIQTDELDATYARLDVANINQAFVEELLVQGHYIAQEGTTYYLTGLHIDANDITAGTVTVDHLAVKGDDGDYYVLSPNGDGTFSQTKLNGSILENNSIHANKILANSITSEQLTTQNIEGTGGWINLHNGTFRYENTDTQNFISWDGEYLKMSLSELFVEGNPLATTEDVTAVQDVSITDVHDEYYISDSPDELTGGSWGTTSTGVGGKYVWRRTKITYGSGTTMYTPDENGACLGSTGVSINYIDQYYGWGTDDTEPEPYDPSASSTDTKTYHLNKIPSIPVSLTGKQRWTMWTYTITYYSDGTSIESPHSIGARTGEDGTDGTDGSDGLDGRGIVSAIGYYAINNDPSTAPSTWETTAPTPTDDNKYLWSYTLITYTDNTSESTDPYVIGVKGEKGVNGTNAADSGYLKWTASTSTLTVGNYNASSYGRLDVTPSAVKILNSSGTTTSSFGKDTVTLGNTSGGVSNVYLGGSSSTNSYGVITTTKNGLDASAKGTLRLTSSAVFPTYSESGDTITTSVSKVASNIVLDDNTITMRTVPSSATDTTGMPLIGSGINTKYYQDYNSFGMYTMNGSTIQSRILEYTHESTPVYLFNQEYDEANPKFALSSDLSDYLKTTNFVTQLVNKVKAGSGITTTAVGTTSFTIAASVGFSDSKLSTAGYVRFTNGLQIVWGNIASNSNSPYTSTTSFGKSFTSTPTVIVCNTGGNYGLYIAASGISTSTVKCGNANNGGKYIAIGT